MQKLIKTNNIFLCKNCHKEIWNNCGILAGHGIILLAKPCSLENKIKKIKYSSKTIKDIQKHQPGTVRKILSKTNQEAGFYKIVSNKEKEIIQESDLDKVVYESDVTEIQ